LTKQCTSQHPSNLPPAYSILATFGIAGHCSPLSCRLNSRANNLIGLFRLLGRMFWTGPLTSLGSGADSRVHWLTCGSYLLASSQPTIQTPFALSHANCCTRGPSSGSSTHSSLADPHPHPPPPFPLSLFNHQHTPPFSPFLPSCCCRRPRPLFAIAIPSILLNLH
jgi:hypothetical protein